jgi:iron complex outermembrane receptor protein
VAVLDLKDDKANSREFIGSADIDYKVHGFEDLRLHATLGADVAKGTQNTNVQPSSSLNNYYGNFGYESILKRNLSLSTYAQYYHDFNDKAKNHFDIMGGYEWQHYYRNKNHDYVGYYPSTSLEVSSTGEPLAGTAREHTPYTEATENYLVSFFGRANWSLMDRYYLTATVRTDGSSRFKEHWATFPSFAFAWKMKDENKFRDISWLSDLKLRLGWGMTGQQDVNNDYAWIPTYSISTGTNGYYPITNVDVNGDGQISDTEKGVLYRPDNYTEKLKWETTTTYNVGLDWGILDQRLSGSVDWYYRKTTDLLNYAPTMVFTAYRNQAWQNIGSLTNTGVEAAISWKAIRSKDWYWTIDYNFTYNKNRITDLNGVTADGQPVPNTNIKVGIDKNLEYHQVGYAANSFWVYQQAYDKNGKAIEGAVVDRNADGQITSADRYFYKNPMAPILMGLSSRLEYKNWDFGFALRASIGNYVYDGVAQGFHNVSANGIWPSTNYLNNTTVRAVADGFQTDATQQLLSDYWVHNASFLKCDNITLGYSFSDLLKMGSYKGMSGRAYVTATNVFTITKYDGLDPEVYNGYDNNMYPRPFSIIVGLNLNF